MEFYFEIISSIPVLRRTPRILKYRSIGATFGVGVLVLLWTENANFFSLMPSLSVTNTTQDFIIEICI